jgi:hypothetical protein
MAPEMAVPMRHAYNMNPARLRMAIPPSNFALYLRQLNDSVRRFA